MVDHILEKRACLDISEIDGFIAAKGPGSFTGLRIGISVIKGLAYATGKPLAGVSSLDGIAFRFAHCSIPVCVMMDARRNQVYCAVYMFDHGIFVSKTKERVVSPEDALAMAEGRALFTGSGSKVYKDIIKEKADNPVFSHKFSDSVSASALVQSFQIKEDLFMEPENILFPGYIRKSDAQVNFDRKHGS